MDRVGKRYNNFTVIEQIPNDGKKIFWKCRCDCGNEFIQEDRHLTRRISCGCMSSNQYANPNSDYSFFVKSGKIDKSTYNRLKMEWISMKSRCKESYHDSHVYFQRGIKICEQWDEFRPFALWAINNGYNNKLTLDRLDNEKGYSPDNCRWATWKEQQNNKRNNVYITYLGKTQTLKQWSEELNIDYGLLKNRYRRGWQAPMLFSEKHINQYA